MSPTHSIVAGGLPVCSSRHVCVESAPSRMRKSTSQPVSRPAAPVHSDGAGVLPQHDERLRADRHRAAARRRDRVAAEPGTSQPAPSDRPNSSRWTSPAEAGGGRQQDGGQGRREGQAEPGPSHRRAPHVSDGEHRRGADAGDACEKFRYAGPARSGGPRRRRDRESLRPFRHPTRAAMLSSESCVGALSHTHIAHRTAPATTRPALQRGPTSRGRHCRALEGQVHAVRPV